MTYGKFVMACGVGSILMGIIRLASEGRDGEDVYAALARLPLRVLVLCQAMVTGGAWMVAIGGFMVAIGR